MFASSGYFSGILCPFYASGLCDRPNCHYKHQLPPLDQPRRSSLSSSTPCHSSYTPSLATIRSLSASQSPPSSTKGTASVSYTPTPVSQLKSLKRKSEDDDDVEIIEVKPKHEKNGDKSASKEHKKRKSTDQYPEYSPTPLNQLKHRKSCDTKPTESHSSKSSNEEKEKKVKRDSLDKIKVKASSSKSDEAPEAKKKARSESISSLNDVKTPVKTPVKTESKSSNDESRAEKQESKPQVSDVDPVSIGKQRIAHQAAIAAARRLPPAKPANRLSPRAVMEMRFGQLEKKPQIQTSTPSVSERTSVSSTSDDGDLPHLKTKPRVAHQPKKEVLKRPPPLPSPSAKCSIPLAYRQKFLNQLIDEYLKFMDEELQAHKRAQEEEKAIHERASSKNIYVNLIVSAVKRIREEAGNSSPSKSPTKSAPGTPSKLSPNKSVSHDALLIGRAMGTFTVIHKAAALKVTDLSSDQLYDLLLKYVMKEDDLKEYGYPFMDPEEPGKVLFVNKAQLTKALKVDDFKSLTRVCSRCKTTYKVNDEGIPLKKEHCIYHPGRIWTERFNRSIERIFSCCKGDHLSGGCCTGDSHVPESIGHPDTLRGFIEINHTLPDKKKRVYCLDCEMCYTTIGFELCRISVVDVPHGRSVYETLVKPKNPVLDLNTKFSGIKPGDLDDVTTTLEDVQRRLLKMIDRDTILMGHSLDSDLKALKIVHKKIIDTTQVFPHRRGLPYRRALRTLMSEYCGKIIQDNVDGHDSIEDAVAVVQLMMQKIKEDLKRLNR